MTQSRAAWPQLEGLPALIDALVRRAGAQSKLKNRQIIFMLGAGVSLSDGESGGIPGTADIVSRIKSELDPRQLADLERDQSGPDTPYPLAFWHYSRAYGPDKADALVRDVVLSDGRRTSSRDSSASEADPASLRALEYEPGSWNLPRGLRDLGWIIARGLTRMTPEAGHKPNAACARFAGLHLTTNFDPLLAVAVREAGGSALPHVITTDGSLVGPDPGVCMLVHLHGRWDQDRTLHVTLDRNRSRLQSEIEDLAARHTIVVVGYGGWTDVVTKALFEADEECCKNVDILWTFYDSEAATRLWHAPLITKLREKFPDRIRFFVSVDSNHLFGELRSELSSRYDARPATAAAARAPRSRAARATRAFALGSLSAAVLVVLFWLGPQSARDALLSAEAWWKDRAEVAEAQPAPAPTPPATPPSEIATNSACERCISECQAAPEHRYDPRMASQCRQSCIDAGPCQP